MTELASPFQLACPPSSNPANLPRSSLHRPRIQPPRAHWEIPRLKRARQAILHDAAGLGTGVTSPGRCASGGGVLVDHRILRLDLVPCITRMLRLNVRENVPFGSLKKIEQQQLCLVAHILQDAAIR
eukprot:scaffold4971_cov254-Pinguiococcus_pyrenoidosus.AAC.18